MILCVTLKLDDHAAATQSPLTPILCEGNEENSRTGLAVDPLDVPVCASVSLYTSLWTFHEKF